MTPAEIPTVVQQIASSLAAVGANPPAPEDAALQPASPKKLTPAQIRKSITPDALVSFEDGKSYKTLRRHLITHGLTIEQYKEKWGLPKDYPTVSPNYSAARSAMAKSLGLGQMRKTVSDPAPASPPATRGRRKAAAKA